ncbi:MAG: hypothetical protein ACFCUR_04720 [Rhodomicrobiaceae bacterium]
MARIFKILKSSAWLLLCVALAAQLANAQKRYPSADGAWDATDYRALVERVERDGLALPTLSGEETKPVFERMINADNIPLRMGQNPELAITVRYQKLKPVLQPLHQLVTLYSSEAQKGKPYAAELARLMVYESRATGALVELGEPFLATFPKDARYQTYVALVEQMKSGAREVYSGLVTSMAETSLYSKSDILVMVKGALNALPSYHPILTDQDRQTLTGTLEKQISATSDPQLKTELTQLHDAIKHSQVPT